MDNREAIDALRFNHCRNCERMLRPGHCDRCEISYAIAALDKVGCSKHLCLDCYKKRTGLCAGMDIINCKHYEEKWWRA